MPQRQAARRDTLSAVRTPQAQDTKGDTKYLIYEKRRQSHAKKRKETLAMYQPQGRETVIKRKTAKGDTNKQMHKQHK